VSASGCDHLRALAVPSAQPPTSKAPPLHCPNRPPTSKTDPLGGRARARFPPPRENPTHVGAVLVRRLLPQHVQQVLQHLEARAQHLHARLKLQVLTGALIEHLGWVGGLRSVGVFGVGLRLVW